MNPVAEDDFKVGSWTTTPKVITAGSSLGFEVGGPAQRLPPIFLIFGGIPKFLKPQNNNKKQTDGEQAASKFFDNSKSPPPWSPNFRSNCSPPA
jgi:hypothetical protein